MENPAGKAALITGGGSGIGFAIAQALVEENINVALLSRRKEVIDSAAFKLNSLGKGKVITAECDIRVKKEVAESVVKVRENFGTINFLINNSGLGVQRKIVDCSEEDWDLVLDTNLKGTFLMTREVLPLMIKQRDGYIINIASQAAKHGYPEAGPYCASKFGLLGFAEALQHEVREYGIRVHSLCPALVQVPAPADEQSIDPNVLQTEDLAATVLFLLKQPRRIKFEDIGLYKF